MQSIISLQSLLLSLFFITTLPLQAHYRQHAEILVYAQSSYSQKLIDNIFRQFNVRYKNTQTLDPQNETHLHIITGNLSTLHKSMMPKHYIVYKCEPTTADIDLLTGAVAVWDASIESIKAYVNRISHYYYLPNDQYEFLDPVILSCFLPLHALDAYRNVLAYSNTYQSDISNHVPAIFCHCLSINPEVIVEAGIRWGDGSTVALRAAKEVSDAYLIGIDVNDCAQFYKDMSNACFLHMNDLDLPAHFQNMQLTKKSIDFAFIDTTHLYDHTMKELVLFQSMLSEHGILAFHDTNPAPADPHGVRDALIDYFNLTIDVNKYHVQIIEKDNYCWKFVHYPFCNGMSIIQRL
jgi:hypothetical protein